MLYSSTVYIFGHCYCCSCVGEVMLCSILDPPDNGTVSYSYLHPGSVATYYCSRGYELVGEEMRTCQANSTWSSSKPTCRRM